jgi:hypothetical protein
LTLGNHTAARPHFELCVAGFRGLGLTEEEKHATAGLHACAAALDVTRPNVARIYDHLAGGKDNFEADRAAVQRIEQISPRTREAVRLNRAFLGRVVRYLVGEAGIRQFIDIGAGLPTQGNVHDIADTINPGTTIVYVDNDPVVVAHADALLTGRRTTAVIQGDLRRPDDILTNSRLQELIDFRRPVAVLLFAIMHFIPDEDNPAGLVARLTAPLTAGSYLAISHGSADDLDESTVAAARKVYSQTNAGLHLRSAAQVAEFFAGFEVIDPGVGWVTQWRPDNTGPKPTFAGDVVGGVAYKQPAHNYRPREADQP